MATNVHQIKENFYWRIETIVPTSNLCGKERFFRIDPRILRSEESAGLERGFWVQWLGSGADEEATDTYQRVAPHGWEVNVVYANTRDWDVQQELILLDRNDLISRLRDDQLYVGYSDAYPNDQLALIDRWRTGDVLQMSEEEDAILLTLSFTTRIREVD